MRNAPTDWKNTGRFTEIDWRIDSNSCGSDIPVVSFILSNTSGMDFCMA